MKYHLTSFSQPIKTRIDYPKELNSEQYKVVTGASGPCLVLAGAGSGKTRTLVYLTAYLLEHKIPAQNIMLVTFTNKAAREMLNRVEILLKYHPRGLWGGTFHHLANRILRKHAERLGFKNNFAILDEDDARSLIKHCMAELSFIPRKDFFPKPDVVSSIISFKQNSLLDFSKLLSEKYPYLKKNILPALEKIFVYYQEKKRKSNSMDFDDLLYYWRLLLIQHPNIAQLMSQQFHYILVDEYQDTNKIQGEIVEILSQAHKNIVVVGDDSQSIYSFRAAHIDNILHFPKKFPHTKIFKLETNYRSTPQILSLANNSISNNQFQYQKELKSLKESGKKPALVPLNDSDQQAAFISQRILELQEEGISLDNIAVLFRAAHQALELELELNKRSIPYEMRGGIRFFEQAHIKDVIGYLKVINNIHDELAWKRILQLYPGIGSGHAQKLWETISHYNNLESLIKDKISINDKVDKSFSEIINLLKNILKQKKDFISNAMGTILSSGYKKYVENNFENAQDRIDDLEELANFALSYKSIDSFLSDVSLSEAFKGEAAVDQELKDKDTLILSTIHQAKGLEWKVVFLIGLVDGQFPHYKVYDRPQEMEEERRLFYVAATRAKDELYLTYPIISYNFRTGQNINHPSTFIKEIQEDLMEKWEIEGQTDLPTIEYLKIDI